jgi:hypothetical protein
MAKLFSFASWNVEHFWGNSERVQKVVDLINSKDPDVFALFEVCGKQVFEDLMNKMPKHSFSITENNIQNDMEILVGVRKSIQSFVTQREEFKAKVPTLRPGALATLRINSKDYSILFLHPKSFKEPRDWGLRDDMFKHVASLKRVLDKNVGPDKTAPFICIGDLNTMGLSAAYNDISDLTEDKEIQFLEKRMASVKMRRLSKTFETSWWNGKGTYNPSKLDHVFADISLNFNKFGNFEVDVVGWPQEPTKAKKLKWIESYSDHALLYGEVK